jgi:hypothetical protein
MTAVALLAGVAVLQLREPAWFSRPDLWAEDGKIFLQQAYNWGGLPALWVSAAGYLHLGPRLVALLVVHLPLDSAPTAFRAAAFIVDALPAVFFVSHRCRNLVPSLPLRAALGLLTLALPDTFETNGNMANAQWHLALLAFLILVALPPRSWLGRAFDIAALVIAGLSGPFSILLLPVAAVQTWRHRSRWLLALTAVLALSAAVQGAELLATNRLGTGSAPLNPSLDLFGRITSKVFLTPLIGYQQLEALAKMPIWLQPWPPLAVSAVGLAAMGYAFWRAKPELRLLIAFTAITYCAALANPTDDAPEGRWYALSVAGSGSRYFYLPMLAWMCVVVWFAVGQRLWIGRIAALALISLSLAVGVRLDWRYPSLPTSGFYQAVERFDQAPAGTRMEFPLEPPGWKMTLYKRS